MPYNIIEESKYNHTNGLKVKAMDRQPDFKQMVEDALNDIRATPTGNNLLTEINSAKFNVEIMRSWPNKRNACALVDASSPEKNKACYLEVLDANLIREKIAALQTSRAINDEHSAVKKYKKFFGSAEDLGYLRAGNPIAHKKRPQNHSTEGKGSEIVRYLQHGLAGYHIMEHLTPGTGTNAMIGWDPEWNDISTGTEGDKAQWMERPSWIGLAHELIHAWRIITGRCVFHPNIPEEYYEEAMTVGLPPYNGCPYTENKIRAESRNLFRTYYGEKTKAQSARAQEKHGAVT